MSARVSFGWNITRKTRYRCVIREGECKEDCGDRLYDLVDVMSCLESKRSSLERERVRLTMHAAGYPHLHPHQHGLQAAAAAAAAAGHLGMMRSVPGYTPGGARLMPHVSPRYEVLHRLSLVQVQPPRNPNKPLTPFYITDILNGGSRNNRGNTNECPRGNQSHFSRGSPRPVPPSDPVTLRSPSHTHHRGIVRPWAGSTGDDDDDDRHKDEDEGDDEDEVEIEVDEVKVPLADGKNCSPLDALFQMTSKTFDVREGRSHLLEDADKKDALSLFAKSQPPKKRRKSRTAFTNQQIYELEKRFLYQKYLTPADRDEIAQNLGLTNAQVITWFQNRRAKLKRDLEEIKNDVVAAKSLSPCSSPGLDSRTDVVSPLGLDDIRGSASGLIRSASHPLGTYVPEMGEIYNNRCMPPPIVSGSRGIMDNLASSRVHFKAGDNGLPTRSPGSGHDNISIPEEAEKSLDCEESMENEEASRESDRKDIESHVTSPKSPSIEEL
uniref:LBX n=1 Tax=Urechis unicinctus TaxID=6432 RepID=A0A5B9GFR9_UREUN|nr:LBX [Urechis unicinctus]